MSDLIRRRAAIDAVHKNYDTILDFKSDGHTVADSFEDIINALPSAQPDIPDTNVGDMISRQAAIDTLLTLGFVWDDGLSDVEKEELDYAIHGMIMAYKERIDQLPSAQPEEVIPHRNYMYLSDFWCECGWHLGKKDSVKYCANCGKKVKWGKWTL